MLLIFNSNFLTYQFSIFLEDNVKLCFYCIIISKADIKARQIDFFAFEKKPALNLTRRFEMQLSQSLNIKQKTVISNDSQLQQAIKLFQCK